MKLVAELRALADRRRPAVTTLDGLPFATPLHVQDVALPSGLTAEWPLEVAHEGHSGSGG